jgi:hypothetical protein
MKVGRPRHRIGGPPLPPATAFSCTLDESTARKLRWLQQNTRPSMAQAFRKFIADLYAANAKTSDPPPLPTYKTPTIQNDE